MDLTIEGGIELNDGKRIPRLAFGTFDLADGDEATSAVACAIEAGYRHIDCARFYGNEKGVGAALASADVPRDELFVTSKVWNDRQIDGTVRQSVEETLRWPSPSPTPRWPPSTRSTRTHPSSRESTRRTSHRTSTA